MRSVLRQLLARLSAPWSGRAGSTDRAEGASPLSTGSGPYRLALTRDGTHLLLTEPLGFFIVRRAVRLADISGLRPGRTRDGGTCLVIETRAPKSRRLIVPCADPNAVAARVGEAAGAAG